MNDFRSEGIDTLELRTDAPVHARAAALLQDPRAPARMNPRVRPWLAMLGLIALLSATPHSTAIADTAATAPSSSTAAASGAAADSAPDDDIRDIRGPKYIFPLWHAPSLVAAAVLLAAGAYACCGAGGSAGVQRARCELLRDRAAAAR